MLLAYPIQNHCELLSVMCKLLAVTANGNGCLGKRDWEEKSPTNCVFNASQMVKFLVLWKNTIMGELNINKRNDLKARSHHVIKSGAFLHLFS